MSKFLLVTDLDNTLVGDDAALAELNRQITHLRQSNAIVLVYSTGRSLTSYQQLRQAKHLLEPDALVTAVGTEIYYQDHQTLDPIWADKLSQGWDRDQVVAVSAHFADLVAQPHSEQRPFKVSYFLMPEVAEAVLPQLDAALKQQNLNIKLVYSGSQDLDILPHHGNKGTAMAFLRQQLGFAPEQTVVCGDSGNDQALFDVGQERGIIVGNAQRELLEWHYANPAQWRYLARGVCAAGILEGLAHFGFLDS